MPNLVNDPREDPNPMEMRLPDPPEGLDARVTRLQLELNNVLTNMNLAIMDNKKQVQELKDMLDPPFPHEGLVDLVTAHGQVLDTYEEYKKAVQDNSDELKQYKKYFKVVYAIISVIFAAITYGYFASIWSIP
jgi:hypothetical protein